MKTVQIVNRWFAEPDPGYYGIRLESQAKEARRLAAWLIRFADWADSKSKGGKG